MKTNDVVRTAFFVGALAAQSGCGTSQAAREAFERYAYMQVGRPAKSLDAGVECGERNGDYGCLRIDYSRLPSLVQRE
jgi:hypothetical protein